MYTVRLTLCTGKTKEQFLWKLFTVEAKIQNVVVKEAKKRLRILNRNKEYGILKKQYSYSKSQGKRLDDRRKSIASRMNEIREDTGLTEASLQKYVALEQKKYSHLISSQMAQEIATRVWNGVEKVLFGNGEDIHFKKVSELHTIASKSFNGIRYYDVYHKNYYKNSVKPKYSAEIELNGVQIEVRIPDDNEYIFCALQNEISYVQIERKMFPSGYKYYVILYMKGDAPKKITKGKGDLGLDPGVSSEAAYTDDKAFLIELAPKTKEYNKRIASLQRKIDVLTRNENPSNYNEDGTIKKGIKSTWNFSKRTQRLKRKLTTLYRKKSEYITSSHNAQANVLIQSCDAIFSETMHFKSLQKRSKKETEKSEKTITVQNKDGTTRTVQKSKRKKRFGKSVSDRAPSEFVSILKRKASQYDIPFYEINTQKFKASQYHHDTDTYIKHSLSERFKMIDGHKVQRDLYSAYLIQNSTLSLDHPNKTKCKKNFDTFLKNQEELILEMKKKNISYKPTFGF